MPATLQLLNGMPAPTIADAPAKTPADVIDRLNKSAALAVRSEAFKRLGANEGLIMVAQPPGELDRYLRGEEARWRKVIEEAREITAHGIVFDAPRVDNDKLRAWKTNIVRKLTGGLALLAKQRKVTVIQGEAKFSGPFSLDVQGASGPRRVEFKQCIIAVGSESALLPGFPDDPRIIDSTGALELPVDCKRLLVIGGGIIGLEMACVYDALGVRVTVVELSDGLMPGKATTSSSNFCASLNLCSLKASRFASFCIAKAVLLFLPNSPSRSL